MIRQLVLRWVLKPTVGILEAMLEKIVTALRLAGEMAHVAT